MALDPVKGSPLGGYELGGRTPPSIGKNAVHLGPDPGARYERDVPPVARVPSTTSPVEGFDALGVFGGSDGNPTTHGDRIASRRSAQSVSIAGRGSFPALRSPLRRRNLATSWETVTKDCSSAVPRTGETLPSDSGLARATAS